MERGLSSQVMLAHPLSGLHSPLSTLSIELFPQPTGIDSGYVSTTRYQGKREPSNTTTPRATLFI